MSAFITVAAVEGVETVIAGFVVGILCLYFVGGSIWAQGWKPLATTNCQNAAAAACQLGELAAVLTAEHFGVFLFAEARTGIDEEFVSYPHAYIP